MTGWHTSPTPGSVQKTKHVVLDPRKLQFDNLIDIKIRNWSD